MAYVNYLAAVDPIEIDKLRQDPSAVLSTTMLTSVSHLIGQAGWNNLEPLRIALSELLDGGELISKHLRHPLRPPLYHSAESVVKLRADLADSWNASLVPDDDWLRFELERVSNLLRHATETRQAVISALQPPMDEARARKVHMPFKT